MELTSSDRCQSRRWPYHKMQCKQNESQVSSLLKALALGSDSGTSRSASVVSTPMGSASPATVASLASMGSMGSMDLIDSLALNSTIDG